MEYPGAPTLLPAAAGTTGTPADCPPKHVALTNLIGLGPFMTTAKSESFEFYIMQDTITVMKQIFLFDFVGQICDAPYTLILSC